MFLFIKIIRGIMDFLCIGAIIVIVIIPIYYLGGIDAIWARASSWEVETVMIVTAIASIIIAFFALLSTIVQGIQNYTRNKLSVQPLLGSKLEVGTHGQIRHVKFELMNYGLGPAIITRIVLFVDDIKELENRTKEYYDFMEKRIKENGIKQSNVGFLVRDSIMEIGNKQVIWSFEYNFKTHNVDFIKKLNLLVEYKSIYGEKMPAYDTRKDDKFIAMKPK